MITSAETEFSRETKGAQKCTRPGLLEPEALRNTGEQFLLLELFTYLKYINLFIPQQLSLNLDQSGSMVVLVISKRFAMIFTNGKIKHDLKIRGISRTLEKILN